MSNYYTNDNRRVDNTANLQNARIDNSISYKQGLSDEAFTSAVNGVASMITSVSDANLEAVRAVQQKDLVSEAIKAKTNLQAVNTTNRNLGNIANIAFNRLETGSKKFMALIITIAGIAAVLWIANKKGLLK